MIAPAFAGNLGDLSRDDVFDNVTLRWENELDFFDVKGVAIPTGVSAFPHEI